MITYKYKIQNKIDISDYIRQFNNVVRFAYNRFQDNHKISSLEIYHIVKSTMNNIDLIDSKLIEYAINKASSIKDKPKAIFGGKKQFFERKLNKITKDTFNKNVPILLRGNKCTPHGNCKAELHIIEDNSILIKFNKKIHIKIQLPKLNREHKKQLSKLQEMCENHETFFTLELDNNYIYIQFEELNLKEQTIKNPKKDRIISLDLNPNYIGLSITDWINKDISNIVYKEIIDLTKINKLEQDSYQSNKRKYEIFEINKRIVNLVKHYRCSLVTFEKLNVEIKDHKKGKKFNKLVNNSWPRKILIDNLKKRCNLNSIKFQEILPNYSSFIGQINNPEEYDSIAASLELARRGYLFFKIYKEKSLPKQEIMFPEFNVASIATRWKEMLLGKGYTLNDIKEWKELYYLFTKKSKSCYRFLFSLDSFQGNSFSSNSIKSMVTIHNCP